MGCQLRTRSALVWVMSLLTAVVVGCSRPASGIEETPGGPASAVPAPEGNPPPAAMMHEIAIDNFTFEPPTLTVPAGTKVTWVNHDDVPHTVTSTTRPKRFDSKALDTDATFSHEFTAPGTYEYFCAVHPKMTGKIIVK